MVRLTVIAVLLGATAITGCSSAPVAGSGTAEAEPSPGSDAQIVPPSTPRPEPSVTLALQTQARVALDRGDPESAIATLERAIRIEPDAPELWLLLSRANLNAGDYIAAEQFARKAMLFTGDHADLEQQAWTLIDAARRPR